MSASVPAPAAVALEGIAKKFGGAEFENVGASLGVLFYRTFWRVTVTMALPSIVAVSMY